MKRGKDDEKVMGPMFPRLHVNDTEKGGPRAPPRNKMALYEHFSIPSQRFNSGVLPLNPNTSSSTAPPASSSQRKKVDEDDFRVPVFIHSRNGQSNDKSVESFDGKELPPTGSRFFGCSVAGQSDSERDPKQFSSLHVNVRKDVRSETDGLPQASTSKEQPLIPIRNISTGENIDTSVRQAKVTPNQEFQDCRVSKLNRLRQNDTCLRRDSGVGIQPNDIGYGGCLVESTRETDKGNAPTVNQTSPAEAINDTERHDTRNDSPTGRVNLNKSDSVSKISRVENLSIMKISPDDVVGIIGQKHFWKARRAIANQQRVFAVQVFELHRLIKVQQLIAGSPDILLEDGAFLGKSPPKGATPKKLTLEYVVKPQQQNIKHKDDSEKLNHKMECSAENAVGKTSLSSVKNGSHLSNYTRFPGNAPQANVGAADSGMGPWCFHQSPGHQWLIPVMTPSEGLVYKPYPGPGFTGTVCGGCGPFGPTPLGGTFMNPAYGVPASHQGIGAPPDTPPGSHAYFPPYGMPAMNAAMSESAVEQVNQFSALGSQGQNGHLPGGEANLNTNNQSSCNLPLQRNGAVSHVMKHKTSKEFELQGSTASSPSEMAQGTNTGQSAEERDVLPLFPMVPAEPESAPQSLETGQQTRVIKVVPHNRRSATASAARIFQSIQEERKQYDSI
ncbi:protein EARLY FLOWERING 3-like isoform X2 [Abrus precatorius]|uniref:Protein EARLY FLOWERING 3-like isoform X2 n=1 Tax=Abrus precatorius TaxID=3816 RepID=A0A8B8LF92_ABRPR|nr:protein EARLY FLOWERING 3-like isoform X2 [Abrus precatorius]